MWTLNNSTGRWSQGDSTVSDSASDSKAVHHSSCQIIIATIIITICWTHTVIYTWLSSLYTLTSLILTTILCTRYYYYPSFSTRNLRHRMFKQFPQGHTAWKWQKQDQNPGSVAPLPQLGPGHDHRIDKKEGIWSNYHLLLHHYIFLTNLYLTVAQTGIVSLRPSKDSWIYNSSSNKN